MKKHKYESVQPRRRVKTLVVIVCAVLILSLSAGATIAYVIAQSGSLENFFAGANVVPVVDDNGNVSNNGNVPAYIRAMVVVNWMDASGNVYSEAPTYTATPNDGWSYDNATDMYYYGDPVNPQSNPIPAPATVECEEESPDSSYSLVVEVVVEAIQAEGMNAGSAIEAWRQVMPSAGN